MHTKPTFILETYLTSPLGIDAKENFANILEKKTSIQNVENPRGFGKTSLCSIFDDDTVTLFKKKWNCETFFDALVAHCINDILKTSKVDFSFNDTVVFLSTTKGNIELIEKNATHEGILFNYSALKIQEALKHPSPVKIISNACISGVSACITAKKYLDTGKYKHALIIGCDVVTPFVLSGFHSFHAVSKTQCKPFDKDRDGIALGEAVSAIILSNEISSQIEWLGGYITNDANHISGPSKTGDELAFCIEAILKKSMVEVTQIDAVSAHGTATVYNDEMESKAMHTMKIHKAPVYSLKGNIGHTLGAAGLVDIVLSTMAMQKNIVLPSNGYSEKGVSGDIVVNKIALNKNINYLLKTASGFGGCNVAALLKKVK